MLLVQTSLTSAATGPGVVLASLSLVLLAKGLAWWLGLRIERRLIEASLRAAVQLFAVGFIFFLIFTATAAIYWAWLWVGVMVGVATTVVVRRAKHRIGGLALVTTGAVLGSALISVAVTFGFRVIAYDPVSLVVIAGITIGNAVPSAVLGSTSRWDSTVTGEVNSRFSSPLDSTAVRSSASWLRAARGPR